MPRSTHHRLHDVLDVIFREDAALGAAGNSVENIALLRRLAMNIVKQADPGRGMVDGRRSATHDPRYLRGWLVSVFRSVILVRAP